jgi:tight adherence protein B
MNLGLIIFLVLAFVAGVLLLEGIYLLWNENRGPEARRLQERLQSLSAGGLGNKESSKLLKSAAGNNLSLVDRLILALPRVHQVDRLIAQAGSGLSISTFVGISLAFLLVGFYLATTVLRMPLFMALFLGGIAGWLPFFWLTAKRRKRLATIESELPEAIDLVSRAMQAGHGFSSALQMVSDELTGPIASEFRILSDELAFGIPPETAFSNLAVRVPTDDIRFFVIAVLLQRETGGNLVEVLQNISKLVRDRLALYGKVKVLSAEGKMSAWVLTGMPIFTALAIQAVNPKFLSVLFTDLTGLKLVYAAIVMIVLGIFWMLRIVKIKV